MSAVALPLIYNRIALDFHKVQASRSRDLFVVVVVFLFVDR